MLFTVSLLWMGPCTVNKQATAQRVTPLKHSSNYQVILRPGLRACAVILLTRHDSAIAVLITGTELVYNKHSQVITYKREGLVLPEQTFISMHTTEGFLSS